MVTLRKTAIWVIVNGSFTICEQTSTDCEKKRLGLPRGKHVFVRHVH